MRIPHCNWKIPVDVLQLHSVSVIVQLAALRHLVVVLHAEGRHLDRGLPLDINGALALFLAFILPFFRSVSTLNNSVRAGLYCF